MCDVTTEILLCAFFNADRNIASAKSLSAPLRRDSKVFNGILNHLDLVLKINT